MKQAILGLTLILAACAAAPPQSREYLLRPPLPEESAAYAARGPAVSLNAIWLAPYLDRGGIVLESAPNQLIEARNERWAEPLGMSLQRILQVDIARGGGVQVDLGPARREGSALAIDVRIYQFHGDLDGRVRLVAEWSLTAPGGASQRFQFSQTRLSTAEGYPAIVAAQLALARQLGEAIGASLRPALAAPPPPVTDAQGRPGRERSRLDRSLAGRWGRLPVTPADGMRYFHLNSPTALA